MFKYIREHKKILIDFIYSFAAYALPTIVLQFVVQPVIAARASSAENGLFIVLFNVIKLMISIFIMPLANLRLIKKQECEQTFALNSFFNFLFIIAISLTGLVGSILNGFYRNFTPDFGDIIRLLIILVLMGLHDYFSIAFRLVLNFKKIVIDNVLIVIGYGIGTVLFLKIGYWELIFICGYLLGSIYVLVNTNLWKSSPGTKEGKFLTRQYSELSASDLLKNSSTYCDRLIIYPILGGYDVSVYNAAAVVSKAISVVSSPLRNVLLSYIVNRNELSISRKKSKKYLPLIILAFIAVFLLFWGGSILACKLLYPKYAASAFPYIPLICFAILAETCGAILNIALLRFAKTQVQTIISAIKLGVYLVAVIILSVVLNTGLWGFCFAIFFADIAFTTAVLIGLKKYIRFTE